MVESLEFGVDETIQECWITEVKERRDEIRQGIVQSFPGEEALAENISFLSANS